jgi:hypothetical protein
MRVNVLHTVDASFETPRPEAPTAYSSLHEHIVDLTERFDLQIRCEVLRHVQEEDVEQLSNVVVTSREVTALLDHPSSGDDRKVDTSENRPVDDAIASLGRRIRERERATLARHERLPWLEIVSRFRLSVTEADVLFACFAVALDRKYERVYGYLHRDVCRRQPTIGSLLAICCSSDVDRVRARQVFWANAPLFAARLLHLTDDDPSRVPFCLRTVCIDERIAAFLDGDLEIDPRIRDCVDSAPEVAAETPVPVDPRVIEQLLSSLRMCGDSQTWAAAPTFYLHGPLLPAKSSSRKSSAAHSNFPFCT